MWAQLSYPYGVSSFVPFLSAPSRFQPDFPRTSPNETEVSFSRKLQVRKEIPQKGWRRGAESNRRIKVLQTLCLWT